MKGAAPAGIVEMLMTLLGLGPARRAGHGRAFNPYVVGTPVLDDDLFVGREALLARVLEALEAGSVRLWGERRIGKTSLLHHVHRRLAAAFDAGRPILPVLVDLQGVGEERALAAIADDVIAELGRRDLPLPARAPRSLSEVLEHAAAALTAAGGAGEGKVVLLIDEADELSAWDPAVGGALRAVLERGDGKVVAVMVGIEANERWARQDGGWRCFVAELPVGPLEPADAAALVERPVRGVFHLDEEAIAEIVALADGRPHAIQRLCTALVVRANQRRTRRITLADVDAVAVGRLGGGERAGRVLGEVRC